MLNIPSHVRVYVCTLPTDMRKSFDGLHALVRQVFKSDPLDGHLFLFRNRRGDRVKIMWWDSPADWNEGSLHRRRSTKAVVRHCHWPAPRVLEPRFAP